MAKEQTVDCTDLFDSAAEKIKGLDTDIDKTIQELAKRVEHAGVPRNKVARTVVKELTARGVLSPSRIYEGLGIEQKRKYVKKELEETFPRMEKIQIEKSSTARQVIEQRIDGNQLQPEDFSKMNRGQGLIIESEKVKKLEQRLNESEEERTLLRQEREDLKNQVNVLKEKSTPELLKELQEKFADTPGLIDAKKLQKISMEAGKHLMTLIGKYNAILQEVVERGKPVPVGTYIMTKPEQKLVPVTIFVDFDRRTIKMSLWEKRLQSLG